MMTSGCAVVGNGGRDGGALARERRSADSSSEGISSGTVHDANEEQGRQRGGMVTRQRRDSGSGNGAVMAAATGKRR
ncbi:hypothetical protein Scep_004042 [Stephania cephalantha]|uniref:Uncharacterized protein n=1 Tax=Stephania cephalantha TaxID=152367 RepID=A0AAP0KRN9_9MAGN